MATSLRDGLLLGSQEQRIPLLGNDTGYLTPVESAQLDATAGNSLTNSFTGARLSNQANAMAAQESSLRAGGDPTSAARLRARIAELQGQAQAYAPAVGRYEDVHGAGDLGSFVAGQLGQGIGSSVDPMATGAAMGLGATALGTVPHPYAKAASLGLRALAPMEMYRQNANLLKGEAYNEVARDPAAMQRPAQDIDREVSQHGYRAAIMDTLPQLLPVGQIAGGFGKALGKVPAWGKFAGTVALEGATETGQQISQHYAHEALNPARDTSGDRSENINSFLGGAIGGGGFGAAGHVAETAQRRLGVLGDGQHGDALPLQGQAPQAALEAAPEPLPKVAAPKGLAERLAAPPDTKDTDAVIRSDLLKGIPPEGLSPGDTQAWFTGNGEARKAAILEELAKLPKDAKAQGLAQRVAALDLSDPVNVLDEALEEGGMYAAEKSGAGRASVEAAGRIERAALAATKNKTKNNWQTESVPNAQLENVVNETRFGGPAKTSGAVNVNPAIGPERPGSTGRPGSGKGAQGGVDASKVGAASPAVVKAAATLQARKDLTKKLLTMKGQDNDHKNFGDLADNLTDELAAMATHAKDDKPTAGDLARAERVGQTLRDLLGHSAPWTLGHIARTFNAEDSPTLQAVMTRVNAEVGPQDIGREKAADDLVALIPPDVHSRLLDKGVDLSRPHARERLLRNIEDFADGTSDIALEPARKLLGKETFDAMLERVGRPIQPREGKTTQVGSQEEDVLADEQPLSSDDEGGSVEGMTDGMRSDEEQSAFEIAGEEKSLGNMPPESMAFHHGTNEGTVRTTDKAWEERKDKNGDLQLPQLLRLDASTEQRKGESAEQFAARTAPGAAEGMLKQRLSDLRTKAEASLGGQRDRYIVAETTAREVMDRQNMQPSKRAELFFKYLEKEKHLTPEQTAFARDRHQEVQDLEYIDRELTQAIGTSGLDAGRTSIRQRLAARLPRVSIERLKEIMDDGDTHAEIDALVAKGRASGSEFDEATQSYVGRGTAEMVRGLSKMVREVKAHLADSAVDGSLTHVPSIKAHIDKVTAERGAAPSTNEIVNNFFGERHMVTAEQASNRDHLQLNLTEFREMANKGQENEKAAWLAVQGLGWKPDSDAYNAKLNEARASMNLIRFKSTHAMGKDGEIKVPAYMLVDWVRSMRQAHETHLTEGGGDVRGKSNSMTRQIEDYKRDLLEGITAMMQNGLTDGLPWIVNAKGERENFKQRGFVAKDSPGQRSLFEDDPGALPPSLDLGGTTEKKAMFNRAFGKDRRRDEEAEHVASQSSLNEQRGIADAQARKDAELAADGTDVQDADATAKAEEEVSGSRTRDAQREDIKINSAVMASAAEAAPRSMTRGKALNTAAHVAEGLWRDFTGTAGKAHARALGRIQAYMNSADRPSFVEPNERPMTNYMEADKARRAEASWWQDNGHGMTGGEHYVFPLAALLTPRHLAEVAAKRPNDHHALAELRSQVADKLLGMAQPVEGYPRISALELGKMVDFLSGYTDKSLQDRLDRVEPQDPGQRKEWLADKARRVHWEGGQRIKAADRVKFLRGMVNDPKVEALRTPTSTVLAGTNTEAFSGKAAPATAANLAPEQAGKRLANATKAEASVAQMEQELAGLEGEIRALRESDVSAGPSRTGGEKLSAMRVLADRVNKLKARMIERSASPLEAVTTGSDKSTDVSAAQGDIKFSPSRTVGNDGEVITFQPKDPNRQIARKKNADAKAEPYEALKVPRTTGMAPYLSAETVEMRTAEALARNNAAMRTAGKLADAARAKDIVPSTEDKFGSFSSATQAAERRVADAIKGLAPSAKQARPEQGASLMERAIAKRQDYLDNPPVDYSDVVVQQSLEWAERQKARVEVEYSQAAKKSSDADIERQDQLSDMKAALGRLAAKARDQLKASKDVLGVDGRNGTSLFGGGGAAAKPVNIWHGSGENAALSNLAARPFTFNKRQYVSVEHAYQANKSGKFDQATFDKYKVAGRKIPGTLGTKSEEGWNLRLMKRLVEESFKQNPDAAAKLAATGDAVLTHTQDTGVWAKEFPRILTEVRSELGATVKNNDQVAAGSTATTTTPQIEVNQAAPLNADIFKARVYIGKVLGPKVQALFEKSFPDMTGAADWSAAKQMIRIATGNPVSVMQRAYHEAMHGFFSNILKNHPETHEMLQRAMSTPAVQQRLEYLLKDWPAAVASMKADPEEAVAYAYQFWAAGMLTVGAKPTNFFEKVQAFMRRVLGEVRDTDKALAIFEAFHDGKLVEPSIAGQAIAKVMATGLWREKFMRRFDRQVQAAYSEVMTAHDVLLNSESETLRKIAGMWWANPGDPASAGRPGKIDRSVEMSNKYASRLHSVLDALSGENQERDMLAVVDRLNGSTAEVSPQVAKATTALHALVDHFYDYAKAAGVKMGERTKGSYWPVVWDLEKMVENKDAFINMLLTQYPNNLKQALSTIQKTNPNVTTQQEVAEAIHQALVDRGGVGDGQLAAHREDGILSPYFASQNTRSFDWIAKEHRQPFLSTDLVATGTRYLHQGVRSAEYVRSFGEGGQDLRDMMAREGDVESVTADGEIKYKEDGPVVKELKAAAATLKLAGKEADEWVNRRMEDAQRASGAMEGVLGKDISASMRKAQSAVMVYQGLRVLTLSLFSAMLDPNGIKVAGGTTQNMLDTYVHGLKNVVGTWKDLLVGDKLHTRGDEQDSANAATVGAVSPTMFLEGMGAAHTSEYTAGPARKINRALFLANGLTAWDRSMRIMAVKAAMQSIASNERNASPEHSERWLRELGLKQGDVTLDGDGKLVIDKHSIAAYRGISLEDAAAETQKVHTAINRWVNRAIVSPNAAQRPSRASDPHYAMFYQLKQFTYSFQKTTMTYALNEARAGNMAAGGQLLYGMPIMIAADVSKAVITGGGSLPGYMANWTMADWLAHSWNRAGLSGIGQFGIDALHDPLGTLGGPAISQAVNAVTHPVGETLLAATPVLNKMTGLAQAMRDVE